jgi:peptide/nickel transport system permease protein
MTHDELGLPPPRRRAALDFVGDVGRRPAGKLGLLIITGLILVLVLGPTLVADPAAQDIPHRLEGPSLDHWLGTDHLGRDLLARLVVGTRIAIGVAVPSVLLAMLLGLVLGLLAGYLGGRTDSFVIAVTDSIQAFPTLVLALAMLALLGPSLPNVVVVIAVGLSPGYVRVARASVFAVKEQVFVEAQRSLGSGSPRIIFVHVLPNIVAPLLILMAIDLPVAVSVEAGLSFLGVGVPPPIPSWGVILSDGFQRVRVSPWPVIWTGLALMVATLGFTLLGEALRDRLDPRVRDLARGTRRGPK